MRKIKKSSGLLSVKGVASLFLSPLLFFILASCDSRENLNILIITADTLRSDHLGCYGYERNTSPRIDELALKGFHFMGAFCPIDLTNPSHISIFTSKYPKNHGVYTNWTPMEKEHVTLAEILKNQGYKTAALVSSNHLNTNISGLGKGFDFFRSISLGQVPANETINNALSWIRENADKNFFVWVHLFDPHMPYNPPSPYDKVFDKRYNGWGKIFFDV